MSVSARGENGRRALRLSLAILTLATAVGCASPAPMEVPPELPLVTNDQLFEFRWALQQEPSAARALGRVTVSTNTEFQLTLALFGLDAEGRIASRGTTYVRSDFARQAVPFAVAVAATGRETRYELSVLEYYVTGIRSD